MSISSERMELLFLAAATSDLMEALRERETEMLTFDVTEGYRIDKTNNEKVPTVTTTVCWANHEGSATCDKSDYSMRQGCLEAIANTIFNGSFDKAYRKAVKFNEQDDKMSRTCRYCGKLFPTVEECVEHEKWHVERRKARHERYLLRKRAKEIAFEKKAQEFAKEITFEKRAQELAKEMIQKGIKE